jgi:hypothetical protein
MPSIIGVIQTISAPKYPARHGRLAFFFELTNGHGEVEITTRLVDVKENHQIIFEQPFEGKFVDVKQVVALGFGLEGIVFPHPGEYRLQIYVGTSLLGERRINCKQIQPQRGDKNNDSANE